MSLEETLRIPGQLNTKIPLLSPAASVDQRPNTAQNSTGNLHLLTDALSLADGSMFNGYGNINLNWGGVNRPILPALNLSPSLPGAGSIGSKRRRNENDPQGQLIMSHALHQTPSFFNQEDPNKSLIGSNSPLASPKNYQFDKFSLPQSSSQLSSFLASHPLTSPGSSFSNTAHALQGGILSNYPLSQYSNDFGHLRGSSHLYTAEDDKGFQKFPSLLSPLAGNNTSLVLDDTVAEAASALLRASASDLQALNPESHKLRGSASGQFGQKIERNNHETPLYDTEYGIHASTPSDTASGPGETRAFAKLQGTNFTYYMQTLSLLIGRAVTEEDSLSGSAALSSLSSSFRSENGRSLPKRSKTNQMETGYVGGDGEAINPIDQQTFKRPPTETQVENENAAIKGLRTINRTTDNISSNISRGLLIENTQRPSDAGFMDADDEGLNYVVTPLSMSLVKHQIPLEDAYKASFLTLAGNQIALRHAHIFYDLTCGKFKIRCCSKRPILVNQKTHSIDSEAVELKQRALIQIGDVSFYFLLPFTDNLQTGQIGRTSTAADNKKGNKGNPSGRRSYESLRVRQPGPPVSRPRLASMIGPVAETVPALSRLNPIYFRLPASFQPLLNSQDFTTSQQKEGPLDSTQRGSTNFLHSSEGTLLPTVPIPSSNRPAPSVIRPANTYSSLTPIHATQMNSMNPSSAQRIDYGSFS